VAPFQTREAGGWPGTWSGNAGNARQDREDPQEMFPFRAQFALWWQVAPRSVSEALCQVAAQSRVNAALLGAAMSRQKPWPAQPSAPGKGRLIPPSAISRQFRLSHQADAPGRAPVYRRQRQPARGAQPRPRRVAFAAKGPPPGSTKAARRLPTTGPPAN
jgi:hypothetical protein